MKEMKRTLSYLLTALVLLTLNGCKKEKEPASFSFNARMEQPSSDTKVHLLHEEWVYWEVGDMISITSDASEGQMYVADLVNVGDGSYTPIEEDFNDFNGVFITEMPYGSSKFLGLFPYRDNNVATWNGSFFNVTIDLPATQVVTNDTSFSRNVYPMVAYYGGEWPYNLDFHSLAGIVRIQLFSSSETKNISSITFTERDRQLVGPFTVDSFITFDPHVNATTNDASKRTLTLEFGEGYSNTMTPGKLFTFYVVLPARGGMSTTTYYNLSMTVNAESGESCTRTFTAPVRRNGITYMNALEISNWSAGTTQRGLVGNGTPDRPFKIYNITDLQQLRDCYNSTERTINGQAISAFPTGGPYIRLMRSDIVLTKDNWTVGIRNFVGTFTSVVHQSHPGITDSCENVPLFESIGTGGTIDGITLKSAFIDNLENTIGVSPFCTQNDGIIRNCVLTTIPGSSKFNLSVFSPFAGLCVTNNGTIEGCRFESRAEVQSGKNFAGICMHNNGTIKGCQISSATVRFATAASKAAGICYENTSSGTVLDSYFAADVTGSAVTWGGIVYSNSGTVEHCYLSSTGHIYTTGRVGGIVKTNSGEINYCWLDGQLRGTSASGIVDSLISGTVINCFNQISAMVTITDAAGIGGGLVGAMTGGSIQNSYVNDIMIMRQNESAIVGGLVGKVTGGSFNNCYSYEGFNHFYGSSSGATYTNCHLVDGSQSMSGIDIVYSSTTDAFVTMQSALNTNKPSGGKGWQGAVSNTTPPILETYTVTPTP